MDTLTYVVVAGWVLMYFLPSFPLALLAAGAMAVTAGGLGYIARTDGVDMTFAGLAETVRAIGPVTFLCVLGGWPLSLAIRRFKIWWRGDAADA